MYSYFNHSKSPLYGFVFTLPLFLFYELGVFIISKENIISMRNGADVLLRQVLSFFGINGMRWLGIIFLIAYIIIYIIHKKKWNKIQLHTFYLPIMMIESLFWSLCIYFFMLNVHILFMNPIGSIIIQRVTLAIGAGIYEEFLFRVLLILMLSKIIIFVFNWGSLLSKITSMIISAGIFSSFHFIGEFGDYFSFNIFMIRFFAGVLLGIIYFFRGFGIVAWAHSIYDLIVLTQITKN